MMMSANMKMNFPDRMRSTNTSIMQLQNSAHLRLPSNLSNTLNNSSMLQIISNENSKSYYTLEEKLLLYNVFTSSI